MNTITNEEIDEAVKLELSKDDKPYTLWAKLKDRYFYRYDRRLNNPVWLNNMLYDGMSESNIAQLIGCSEQLVHKKLELNGLVVIDYVFNVNTGHFHWMKKYIGYLIHPHIKKVQTGVASVYDKTKSRNATIFKNIIADLEFYDVDTEASMSTILGLTRKNLIILIAKFFVCIYEYDNHYSERIDYVLERVLIAKESFYLDETRYPENWYPHRDMRKTARYMILRNKK